MSESSTNASRLGPRGVELRLFHCGHRELRYGGDTSSDDDDTDGARGAFLRGMAPPDALPKAGGLHRTETAVFSPVSRGGAGSGVGSRDSGDSSLRPGHDAPSPALAPTSFAASSRPDGGVTTEATSPSASITSAPGAFAAVVTPPAKLLPAMAKVRPPQVSLGAGSVTPQSQSQQQALGRRVAGAVWASASVVGLAELNVTVADVDRDGVLATIERVADAAVGVAERLGLTSRRVAGRSPAVGPALPSVLLRVLELPGCGLGDRGFAALIDALAEGRKKYAYLERLDVRFNGITDAGAESVAALVHLIDAELVAEKQRRIAAETARVMQRQDRGFGPARRAAGAPTDGGSFVAGAGRQARVTITTTDSGAHEPPSPSSPGHFTVKPSTMLERRKSLGMTLAESVHDVHARDSAAVPVTESPRAERRRSTVMKLDGSGFLSPAALRRASVVSGGTFGSSVRSQDSGDGDGDGGAENESAPPKPTAPPAGATAGAPAPTMSPWERARNKLLVPRRESQSLRRLGSSVNSPTASGPTSPAGSAARRIGAGSLEPSSDPPFFSNLVLPSLRFLDLGDNDLSDEGAGSVAAALLACGAVRIALGLDGNDITPAVDGGSTTLVSSQSRAAALDGDGGDLSGAASNVASGVF